MNKEQRIAAIRSSLAAIEAGIGQVRAALQVATNVSDAARLNNELVSLSAKRTQLQFELMNLEASRFTVAALDAERPGATPLLKMSSANTKKVRTLSRELQKSVNDRRMVEAALAQSGDVLGRVSLLMDVLTGKNPTGDDD